MRKSKANPPHANQPWKQLKGLCALMASDARRQILINLSDGPLDVGSLSESIDRSISWTSSNLKRLSEFGLVQCDQVAHRRVYRLGPHANIVKKRDKVTLTLTTSDGMGLTIDARGRDIVLDCRRK